MNETLKSDFCQHCAQHIVSGFGTGREGKYKFEIVHIVGLGGREQNKILGTLEKGKNHRIIRRKPSEISQSPLIGIEIIGTITEIVGKSKGDATIGEHDISAWCFERQGDGFAVEIG